MWALEGPVYWQVRKLVTDCGVIGGHSIVPAGAGASAAAGRVPVSCVPAEAHGTPVLPLRMTPKAIEHSAALALLTRGPCMFVTRGPCMFVNRTRIAASPGLRRPVSILLDNNRDL
jgi:hypothetical protein